MVRSASPSVIPKHLRDLRVSLESLLLPPRRSKRRFPRAVKIKMSNNARKRRKGRVPRAGGGSQPVRTARLAIDTEW